MANVHNPATRTWRVTESGIIWPAGMLSYLKLVRVASPNAVAGNSLKLLTVPETGDPFEFWATYADAANHIDEVLWENYLDEGLQVEVEGDMVGYITYK